MKILFIFFISIYYLVCHSAFSAEIDTITPGRLKLENSLSDINTLFNKRIREGIQKANEKQDDIADLEEDEFCEEEVLYTELRKAIFQSFTASWGLKGYELDTQLRRLLEKKSYSLSLNDSIYRDINYIEGISLNVKELSDVVNINGHLIGLDKIGHFFAEGWHYFELTQDDEYGIEKALKWGKQQEAGKFGYSTTGIFSFADLTANFNGWRFWNKVLLKKKDPVKGSFSNFFNSPYISCETQYIASLEHKKIVKAWEYNTRFDFSDYVDGTWNEANNCNSYENPVIEEKVSARIKNVSPDFSCPLVADYCVQAQEKYAYYAKYILHPYCLTATEQ